MIDKNNASIKQEMNILASMFIELVSAAEESRDRARVATMMEMAFCKALTILYPERSINGGTILDIVSDRIKKFPFTPVERGNDNGTQKQHPAD